MTSKETKVALVESQIAHDLEELQNEYQDAVAMGSYPFKGGTALVFRGIDEEKVNQAHDKMMAKIPDSSKI